MTIRLSLLFLFTSFCYPASASPDSTIVGPVDDLKLNKVQKLLDVPEDEIDFAYSKLAIDQMVDPEVDVAHEMKRLDEMVNAVKAMEPFENSIEKVDAVRRFLYESGPWNQYRPFSYDFNDPKGTKLQNKLLGHYMDSRKGNCVSMPILFIILAQKLGLNATASNAPSHIFVKLTDESGNTINIEATSGGTVARDSWLRQQFPTITDLSIRNGIYLRKLTRKETVAAMAEVLLEFYHHHQQFGQLVATADLILSHHPKAIGAVVQKASAHNEVLKVYDLWRYHGPNDVPVLQRDIFEYLIYRVNIYHEQAVRMGWQPHTTAENEAYYQKIALKALEQTGG